MFVPRYLMVYSDAQPGQPAQLPQAEPGDLEVITPIFVPSPIVLGFFLHQRRFSPEGL